MSARILWGAIIVLAVALAAWYVTAHQAAQPAAAPGTAATTTPAATAGVATSSQDATPQAPQTSPSADITAIKSAMVGSWQSIDDGNYKIKITAGGSWTDSYGTDKSAAQTGTYTLFTNTTPEKDLPIPAQPGAVYLKVVEGHSTFYYSVIAVSNTMLQISYLARGNTLAFVRVQ